MKSLFNITALLILLAVVTACENNTSAINEDTEGYFGLNVPDGFDFSTTQEVQLSVAAKLPDGSPVANVRYDVFDADPFEEDSRRLGSYFVDANGALDISLELPAHLEQVYVGSYFPGAGHFMPVDITSGQGSYNFDPAKNISFGGKAARLNLKNGDWNTLGDWSPDNGRPEYLTIPDDLDMSFLERIDALLPESKHVPNTNPSLIENSIPRDLYIQEDAQVWITFIASGAGWRNSLGYYYYEEGNKPQTPEDITNKTMLFPYAHTRDDALYPGAKVQLQGPLEQGGFAEGTKIGWFLVANGWLPNQGEVGSGNWILYADQELNTILPDPELRQHTVMAFDVEEQKLIMGWEDWRRDQRNSDQDFNDVLFYTSWNPLESVDVSEYPEMGDPEEGPREIENYSPGEGSFGTLAFEDLWPSYGDYDMNDLVVDYQVKETADANNNVSELEFTLVIRATGASFRNGLGFELNTPAANVASVSGNRLSTGNISTNANGTEAGHENAVIVAFDDANENFTSFGNVFNDSGHTPEDTLVVNVEFNTPVPKQNLGTAPYNPFIILNQNRGREVHLPGMAPTSLVNTGLFGTGDDDTRPESNRFYQSVDDLNWAIHVPVSIPYAREGVDKTDAFLRFREWAESGGTVYQDWYMNESGYRNSSNLYIAP